MHRYKSTSTIALSKQEHTHTRELKHTQPMEWECIVKYQLCTGLVVQVFIHFTLMFEINVEIDILRLNYPLFEFLFKFCHFFRLWMNSMEEKECANWDSFEWNDVQLLQKKNLSFEDKKKWLCISFYFLTFFHFCW